MRSSYLVPVIITIALAMSWHHGRRASRQLSEHGDSFRREKGWLPRNAGREWFTAAGWRDRNRMHAWAWGGLAVALGVWVLRAIYHW